MDIFVPHPHTKLPGSTFPDASITPVNSHGEITHDDIANSRAFIHVFPFAGIQLGDVITCAQTVKDGTWISPREVTDPGATINVIVRSLNGDSETTIWYHVRRNGELLGRSGDRVYKAV